MFGRFESTTCPVIPATKCENNDNTSKLPAKLFVNALPGTSTGRSLFEDFCKGKYTNRLFIGAKSRAESTRKDVESLA
jgi:hypothetical protein